MAHVPTLAELRERAELLLQKSNEAETVEERMKLDEELEKTINQYTSDSKIACYKAIAASDKPMHKACIDSFYPSIRLKETKDKTTLSIVRTIEDCQKLIDISEVHKKLGGIGADPKWFNMAETFNFYMTVRAAKRIGATVNCNADIIKNIHKEIELGKDPVADKNLLVTLNMIIKAMIGDEYEATIKDVNFICDTYISDDKKATKGIKVADHKTFRHYLKKVCNHILTGSTGYGMDAKEVEKLHKA